MEFLAIKCDDLTWLAIAKKKVKTMVILAFNNTVYTSLLGENLDIVLKLKGGILPSL